MSTPRFLLNYTLVPDEALWCQCVSHTQLLDRCREAWGSDLQPIFKYFLESHVERGLCEVLVDDEQDFAVWYFGSGNHQSPQPLTDRLFVFDRRRLPRTRGLDSQGGLYTFPTVGHEMLKRTGATVTLRHSDCRDVILMGRADVIGDGSGEWGRLVIKARQVWRVLRPVFRYKDAKELLSISIFNPADFCLWSQHNREHNPELTVFEGAPPDMVAESLATTTTSISPKLKDEASAENHNEALKPSLHSAMVHHELVVTKGSAAGGRGASIDQSIGQVDRLLRAQKIASDHVVGGVNLAALSAKSVASSYASPTSGSVLQDLVARGHFGPTFTTPAKLFGTNQLHSQRTLGSGDGESVSEAAQHHLELLMQGLGKKEVSY